MSMQSERGGDHIDAAVDAAARSLTTGEPSAALRMGVRDRISERSPVASAFPGPPKLGTSEGGRRKSWWLVPAGAMTALIAVMIGGRTLLDPALSGGPDKARPPDSRPADVRLSTDRATTQSMSRTGGPDVGRTLSGPPARPAVTPPPLAAATLEPPFEELEPLIPPITIEPLETKLIAVGPSSGVMPIEIEPLRIEPLQGASEE